MAAFACDAGAAFAQANLTAETASPGKSPHLTITHLADLAGQMGIANLQVQKGHTLTNSVLNVAEGKTDIAAAPIFLTFLLDKGRGPYAKQGEKGAALAAKLRAFYPYNAGLTGCLRLNLRIFENGRIFPAKPSSTARPVVRHWSMHARRTGW